jgi:hypothetical protein
VPVRLHHLLRNLNILVDTRKPLYYSILAHDVSNWDLLLLRHVRSTTPVLACRLYLAKLFPLLRTTRLFVFL